MKFEKFFGKKQNTEKKETQRILETPPRIATEEELLFAYKNTWLAYYAAARVYNSYQRAEDSVGYSRLISAEKELMYLRSKLKELQGELKRRHLSEERPVDPRQSK